VHSRYAGFRLGALGRFGRWPLARPLTPGVSGGGSKRRTRIATRTAETAEATAVVTQSTRVVRQHGRAAGICSVTACCSQGATRYCVRWLQSQLPVSCSPAACCTGSQQQLSACWPSAQSPLRQNPNPQATNKARGAGCRAQGPLEVVPLSQLVLLASSAPEGAMAPRHPISIGRRRGGMSARRRGGMSVIWLGCAICWPWRALGSHATARAELIATQAACAEGRCAAPALASMCRGLRSRASSPALAAPPGFAPYGLRLLCVTQS
jgi:hypothetical protein